MGTLVGVMPLLRGRVTLMPDTVALRLEVEGGRLAGVVLAGPDGVERVVRPDHLVLSAGAYGTPELLLRSGIGPAAELEAEGVAAGDRPARGGAQPAGPPVGDARRALR